MCHAIPAPLRPRCFPVLVCTASASPTSFLAVSIPVDLRALPASFYSNGRNATEGVDPQQKKKPVIGMYTAVERAEMDDKGEIEWAMATASDARGVLPMFLQKMSIPGQIAKDVGLFLRWISSVDRGQTGPPTATGAS